ncbi:SRPBCC family protein [Gordonia sp. CPCC 206044]|uniref:SRPBCC family protein n=1 Tax=Gordonia sp. CPCC 206044 TaxID=3140793 RepID=UPI003AF35CDA
MTSARVVPVAVEAAFDRTLPVPLEELFKHWYGPIGPVRETVGDEQGWGSVGQTRTVIQSAGGGFTEELTRVDRPHAFGYRLTRPRGPLGALITDIDGEWTFDPHPEGTLVTWRWDLHFRSATAARTAPVIRRLWGGYARRSLAELEALVST